MRKSLLLAQLFAVAAVALPQTFSSTGSKNSTDDGKPLIDSEALQATIEADNLLARAEELYSISQLSVDEYGHETRVIGSPGHLGTLDYITSVIEELGDYYNLTTQDFPVTVSKINDQRLTLDNVTISDAFALSGSPSTPNKQPVVAPLVLVANNGCNATDYPANVTQAIAFIRRGTCKFVDKDRLAASAGAVAVVIYNNAPEVFNGTLGEPTPELLAAIGISGDEAQAYVDRLNAGAQITASVFVDADVSTTITTNVLAQTVDGDQDNCVVLGAHSDSVEPGPGINDDGSGTISLLEIATQLTAFRVNNCVRFAWWAAEEEGLLGSTYYANNLSLEENLKIRLFMDYDMVASPNFAYQIYNATNAESPVGSEELRDLYVEWYERNGLNYTFIPFDGRSDYQGFIDNGIPAGGIVTGAEVNKTEEEALMFGGIAGIAFDPCYHQLCDNVSNLNMTAFETNAKLIAHSVARFALTFEGFPERTPPVTANV